MIKFSIGILFLILSIAANAGLYVLGDSHSLIFQNIENCRVNWVGPWTMYRIGRDGFHLGNFGIPGHATVILSFGEIDVRCHIRKQCELRNISLEEMVRLLAANYIHSILDTKNTYEHLNCIVYAVLPPTDQVFNSEVPRYGSLEDRVQITKALNRELAFLCSLYEIPFLDVYDDYANETGSFRESLSDGVVHIHPDHRAPLERKLRELLALWELD